MDGRIDVVVGRAQAGEGGIVGVDDLTQFGVRIACLLCDLATEVTSILLAEQNPGVLHRLQGVPRRDDLAGCIGPELQVQSVHPRGVQRVANSRPGGLRSCRSRSRFRCAQQRDRYRAGRATDHRKEAAARES